MTLQELLSMKIMSFDINNKPISVSPEFRVSVQRITSEGVHVIIHPMNVNGTTLDLFIRDNEVKII